MMKSLTQYVFWVIALSILNIYLMNAQSQSGFSKKSKEILLFDYKDIKTDRNDQLTTGTQNITLQVIPSPVPDDCDLIDNVNITEANLYLSFETKVPGEEYFSLIPISSPKTFTFEVMTITANYLSGTPDIIDSGATNAITLSLDDTGAIIPDQMVKINLSKYLTSAKLKILSSIDIVLSNPMSLNPSYDFYLHTYYEEKRSIDIHGLNSEVCFSDGILKIISPTKTSVVGINNQVIFSWELNDKCTCTDLQFPHYQLQILKLENFSDTDPALSSSIDPTSFPVDVIVDWNKALTIETSNQAISSIISDTLFLKDGTGYYVWRVRPFTIQINNKGFNEIVYGNWSYLQCDGTDQDYSQDAHIDIHGGASMLTDKTGVDYLCSAFYYNEPEDNLNWVFNRVFTEDIYNTSKPSESMTYLNHLLKPVQSQTTFKSDDYTFSNNKYKIVSQLFYDNIGRPSLQSIPIPYWDNDFYSEGLLGFQPKLFTRQSDPTTMYSKDDFDVSEYRGSSNNYNEPEPTRQTLAPGGYYSNDNDDDRIPNSEGYNFTRTIYKNDGTGRILQIGLPGGELKANATADKNYKFFQSGVSDIELKSVFGEDAPDPKTVTKQITKDPNGVINISYYNKEGQLIMTCISNEGETSNLSSPVEFNTWDDAWSSSDENLEKLFDQPCQLDFDDAHKLNDERTLAIAEPTLVTFHYSITPKTFQEDLSACTGDEICYSCDYVIQLFAKNTETGEIVDPGGGQDKVTTITLNPFDLCSSGEDPLPPMTYEINYTLDPGQYIFVKKITTGSDASGTISYSPYNTNNYEDALVSKLKEELNDHQYQTGSKWKNINLKLDDVESGTVTLDEFYAYVITLGATEDEQIVNGDTIRYLTIDLGDCCPVTFTEYRCPTYRHLKWDEFEDYLFTRWSGKDRLVTGEDLGNTLNNYFYRDGAKIYSMCGNGTFNSMIDDMTNHETGIYVYDINELARIWTNIVDNLQNMATYRDNLGHYKYNKDFDLLDYFLSRAGYRFKGISYSECSTIPGAMDGYISNAYSHFHYFEKDSADGCSCTQTLGYDYSNPWAPDSTLPYYNGLSSDKPLYKTLFYCLKYKRDHDHPGLPFNNISNFGKDPLYKQFDNKWPTDLSTDGFSTFIDGIHDTCINACVKRASAFRKQLIIYFNTHLFTDPGGDHRFSVQDQDFYFDNTDEQLHDPEGTDNYDIATEELDCLVDALITDCGNLCDVSSITAPLDCDNTDPGGRYDNLILAMLGSIVIHDCGHPEAYTGEQIIKNVDRSVTSSTGPYEEEIINAKVDELNQWLDDYIENDVLNPSSEFNDKFLNIIYSGEPYHYTTIESFWRSPYRLNKTSIDIRNKIHELFGTSCTWDTCMILETRGSGCSTPLIGSTGNVGSLNDLSLSKLKYIKDYNNFTLTNTLKGSGKGSHDKLLDDDPCYVKTGCDSIIGDPRWTCSTFNNDVFSNDEYGSISKVFYIDDNTLYHYDFTATSCGLTFNVRKYVTPPSISTPAACSVVVCDDICPTECGTTVCIDYYIDPTPVAANQNNEPIECSVSVVDEIRQVLNQKHDLCITDKIARLKEDYDKTCHKGDFKNLFSQTTYVSYDPEYYHYTLYYYDRAGNLVTTVPPKGVDMNPTYDRTSTPSHKYMTQYQYNSFGQVTRVKTPESYSNFFYNHKGQLRFSSNSRQDMNYPLFGLMPGKTLFNYYKYDRLGRMIETGESYGWEYCIAQYGTNIALNSQFFETLLEDDNFPTDFYLTSIGSPFRGVAPPPMNFYVNPTLAAAIPSLLKNRIYYHYDSPAPALPAPYSNLKQKNLRNRLSYAERDNVPIDNSVTDFDKVITYFSYDVQGNVKWVIQEIPRLVNSEGTSYWDSDIQDKLRGDGVPYDPMHVPPIDDYTNYYKAKPIVSKIDYDYDLISGNVKKISFNKDRGDEFYQRYTYDLDNRVMQVESSRDDILYDIDATYSYYPTGELRSVKIGRDYLQDVDYTYTITGLPKAINHSQVLKDPTDIVSGSAPDRQQDYDYLKDYFGAIAGYSPNDFNKTGSDFANSATENLPVTGLYDGSMEAVETGFNSIVTSKMNTVYVLNPFDEVSGQKFSYDRLYRLTGSTYMGYNPSGSPDKWTTLGANKNRTFYSYDPNGNLTKLVRNRPDINSGFMDSLFYNYISNTDKLSSLNDYASTTGLGYHDLQNGGSGYQMTYDPMGNLLTDNGNSDGYSLNYSHYNMHEKPDTTRGNTPLKDTDPVRSMANTTSYYYDAFGNQVATKTISVFENNEGHEETDITTNYTVVDASGIPLASYMFKYGPATTGPGITEYHFGFDYKRYVYGGAGQGRAAILLPDEELQSSENMFYPYYNIKLYDKMAVYPSSLPIMKLYHRDYKRGRKIYEIKDFQGTPRLMFSDKRFVSGGVDQLDLKSVQNYYPYGMEIPFRTWAADAIRYGFQGMDKDTTFAPNNEFYTTLFRSYDPRKARWLQRDPIHHPWESSYSAFGSNPIMFTDPLGADKLQGMSDKSSGTELDHGTTPEYTTPEVEVTADRPTENGHHYYSLNYNENGNVNLHFDQFIPNNSLGDNLNYNSYMYSYNGQTYSFGDHSAYQYNGAYDISFRDEFVHDPQGFINKWQNTKYAIKSDEQLRGEFQEATDYLIQTVGYAAIYHTAATANEAIRSWYNPSPVKFAELPEKGAINPYQVRFSQDNIGENFKDGRSVEVLIKSLKEKKIDPSSIPAIQIVEKDGLIYTLDNRRLYVFQRAGLPINYEKVHVIPPKILKNKFTTQNEGISIQVRKGRK